jgi:hypothetical protein
MNIFTIVNRELKGIKYEIVLLNLTIRYDPIAL